VSHNHVDSSVSSALKAIAFLTLSIVTIVSPPWLSSNLPEYLGSAVMKIMSPAISGCCGFRFVVRFVRLPPLHAKHLPVTEEIGDTSPPAASLVFPFDLMRDDDAEDQGSVTIFFSFKSVY